MKTILLRTLLVLTAALVLSNSSLHAADRILLSPSEVQVDPGDTFSIFIALDTGVLDIHAYRVHLKVDTELVAIDTVVETPAWSSAGQYQFTSKDTTINSSRVYDAFSVYWQPATTIDGYVEVARVQLTALDFGLCSLYFNYFLVKDNQDSEIVSQSNSALIRIGSCPYAGVAPGDINGSGANDIADLTYLVSYMFGGGPVPIPDELAANFNCTGGVDIADLTFIVAYMFAGGPTPCDLCGSI